MLIRVLPSICWRTRKLRNTSSRFGAWALTWRQLLFLCLDLQTRYLRVRYCSQARCVENNVFVVLSGACGNLPFVEGADVHYSQSCILTPSDIRHDRDGIAAEATPNVETMLVHDLDLDVLRRSRRTGSVRTWRDRRRDMYRLTYVEDGKTREA